MLRADCYIVLTPDVRHGKVRGFKATRLTQNRPRSAEAGDKLLKLTIKLPESAFDPMRAELEVPAEFLETPVEIEPEEPEHLENDDEASAFDDDHELPF